MQPDNSTHKAYVSLSLYSETTNGEKKRARNDVHDEEELGPYDDDECSPVKKVTAVKESRAGKMYDSYTAEIG